MENLIIEKSILSSDRKIIKTRFNLNDSDNEVYFKIINGDSTFVDSLESNIVLGLLPSIKSNIKCINVSDSLSEMFVRNLETIQQIYNVWGLGEEVIKLNHTGLVKKESSGIRVGSFFSGGVDSFYTLLKNRDEITDIIFIHGLDIKLKDKELRDKVSLRIKSIAKGLNLNLLEIETNVRDFLDPFVDWGEFGHGAALASIALSISGDFKKIYIPATHSFKDLFPWGSHPVLDNLWSTEALEFVHDGCEATRVQKVTLISGNDIALQNLRVCYTNKNSEYNCGVCEKCLRTMVNLEVNNALKRTPVFSNPLILENIGNLNIASDNSRSFVMENIQAIDKIGGNEELKEALKASLNISLVFLGKKKFKFLVKKVFGIEKILKFKSFFKKEI
jgi:hypothetical protein